MENRSGNEERDTHLWQLAKKRAGFKASVITYLIVNGFLWAFWYFTQGNDHTGRWPWPVWPTLGWGIGLLFQFFGAYVNTGSVENEYEKLKRKNGNK